METIENDLSSKKETENEANINNEEMHEEVIPMDEKEQKINELKAQVDELNDRYLRLYSEFDNYKKRSSKERIEMSKTAGEEIIKSLFPVIDDIERALRSNEKINDTKLINEGFKLIAQKFTTLLKGRGVEPMESVGKDFNPDLHEAITNLPAPSEELKGKVIEEIEKGYSMNGKVIRFAKVVVGS